MDMEQEEMAFQCPENCSPQTCDLKLRFLMLPVERSFHRKHNYQETSVIGFSASHGISCVEVL
jgi:hypothetical protein